MNLYNRNTAILKNFFKKPLTLIISILFFSAAVIPCIYLVVKMTASGVFDSFTLCAYSLLAVLPSVAFLNLFIQGRKRAEINRLNMPLILIYIYTILSVFAPIAFFAYFLLYYYVKQNETSFVLTAFSFAFLVVPITLLLILHFVSVVITFHSIRKSANRIYLSQKGSDFMAVSSFLVAAAVTAITINLINTTSYSRILNYNSIFESFMLMLESAVLIGLFICLGIWALMYSSTIKKASVHLFGAGKKSAVKVQTLADVQSVQYSKIKNDIEQSTQNFVPQQAFANEETPIIAKTNYEKPDIFALPKQNEPNPYGNSNIHYKRTKQEETPNHINFQNPYEDFVPQNPFSNE